MYTCVDMPSTFGHIHEEHHWPVQLKWVGFITLETHVLCFIERVKTAKET